MARKKKDLKQHQNLQCHWHCPCEDNRLQSTIKIKSRKGLIKRPPQLTVLMDLFKT
jgi:hypothetical protein